jgi:hypothetical protein
MPEKGAITVAEAGRRGGTARARNLTPEQLQESGRNAYLAGAVRTIVRRWADLSDAQRQAISEALAKGGVS